MIICPNFSNPEVAREFEELKNATSEAAAYHIWSLNNGNAIDKAPNGAESKLFQTLLEHYNGDRVKAIQAKAKVYGSSFIKWFGDWTGNATYEVYQGRISEIDDRRYNYWSRYENDAKSYGPNVRKVRIDPSGFLFKREQRWRTNLNGERVFDWSWSEEYEKVMAEFKEKTGYDGFDILENSKEGLKKQNAFFEFLESKGYKGYAEFNELELTEEHDNPYTVTFEDNGIIDPDVSKAVDENGEPLAEFIDNESPVLQQNTYSKEINSTINEQPFQPVVTPPLKQQLEFKKADLKGEIRKLQDKINTLERNFIRKIPGKNMIISTPYGDLSSTYGFIDNNAPSIFGKVSARFKMNKNNVESSLLFPSKWMFTPDNNYTRLENSLRSNQPQISYNLLEYLKLQGFNRVYSDWQLEHKVLDTQIPDVDLGVMGLGMLLEMSGKYVSDELIEEFDRLYGKGAGQLLSVEKRPDPNDEKATQFRVSANIDELQAKIKQNNPEVRVSNDYIALIKSTQDTSHERSEEDKQMARSEIEKLVEQQREYAKQIAEIEEQIKEEQNKEFKEWQEYLKTLGEGLEESCALPF